jgi:ribosomal protein L32E
VIVPAAFDRSRIVPILRPWRRAKGTRSSMRAMVPSSRMISQITPED